MNREQISALMDSEFDNTRAHTLCAQMKSEENSECWAAYHLIGDALRSECFAQKGFSKRFAERLALEPTILAPALGSRSGIGAGIGVAAPSWRAALSGLSGRRIQYAMAATAMLAAVGVVGWFGMQEFRLGPGLNELATSASPAPAARASGSAFASTVAASSVQASRKAGGFGISPYLLVHQEYSPTTAMQGVRPYVRTVADMTVE